jgi:hypothetical protein
MLRKWLLAAQAYPALGLLGTFALLVDVLQQSINKRAKVALTVAK